MNWDYRVVKKGDQFAIHEAFYREDGSIEGYTESPVFPRAESLDELSEELKRYASALEKPVINYES